MRPLIVLLLLARAACAPPAYAFDPAPVAARHGMVVSAQHLATDVGVEILKQGGNAVDAAVAVGYALAVVYPAAGNLGGGGFMTVRMADGGTPAFLDFRERAPLSATAGMFLGPDGQVVKGRSTDTWFAVAVPGTPAGLEAARARWGNLSRAALIAPAIELAKNGFVLTDGDAPLFRTEAEALSHDPAAAAIFLPDGHPPEAGDRLIQHDLAHTLQQLSADGPDAFYHGPIGAALLQASAAGGGIFQKADLDGYATRLLDPVRCDYRGYQVISAPPPSSGGTALCEMLNILEGYDLQSLGYRSAASVHFIAEAMRHAFKDRNAKLGDPAFTANPVAELTSKPYAASIRATIKPEQATPSADLPPGVSANEGSNTTHYSVVDSAGNAVAVTYTLNAWFGVKKVVPGTGILLNNEMDDFTAQPGKPNMFGLVQGEANAIAPGKTPLSSMTPTILVRDEKTAMVLGSPGGPRIITTVLNQILNLIDYGMTVQAAVDAPRIHHQWLPDQIVAERFALGPDTRAKLESWGYKITDSAPWGIGGAIIVGSPRVGPAPKANAAESLVLNDPAATGATLFGASDPRGGAGSAAGY